MKGMTLNEFIDNLYCAPEVEYVYLAQRHMLGGWKNEDGTYSMYVCLISAKMEMLFKYTGVNVYDCVEKYENARIYNGKNIYEAENEIEVLYS